MRHLRNIWSFNLPAVLWLDAAAVFAETSFSLGAGLVPDAAGEIMSAAAAASSFALFPIAWKRAAERRAIKGRKLAFIKIRELIGLMRSNPGQLWLGTGFEWKAAHTERIMTIERSGLGQRIRNSFGAPYLHGVETREKNVFLPFSHTSGHTLILGTTGAGKTRLFELLITQAIVSGDTVIIIDPKGDRELRDHAREVTLLLGSPERFAFFHPGFPRESFRINPLEDFSRSTELASRIASLIPAGNNPAFKNYCEEALDLVIEALLASGERPTLKRVRDLIVSEDDRVRLFLALAERLSLDANVPLNGTSMQPGQKQPRKTNDISVVFSVLKKSPAFRGMRGYEEALNLYSVLTRDPVHFEKMTASLRPVLTILTAGELGSLISPDYSDLSDDREILSLSSAARAGRVLYFGLDSLTDSMASACFGSLLLADLTAIAGEIYNYSEKKPRTLSLFVDETAEGINEPFIQLLNKGRGAGIRCFAATQTVHDLEARLGSAAKAGQVLGNLNNIISLRVTDAETQKFFTDTLPEVSVLVPSESESSQTSSESPLTMSGSESTGIQETREPAVPPAALGSLPNFEYYARISGGKLVKGRFPLLTGDSAPEDRSPKSARRNNASGRGGKEASE